MSGKTIVVLATLDTKGTEADFLRQQIEAVGDMALIVDTGVVGEPAVEAGVTRQAVAEAAGTTLQRLLDSGTREVAAPKMAEGATNVVLKLVQEGEADGIVAMGGTQGTTLSTAVMRALPYGFPKVMVSTMASGNTAPWVDIKDITMMFSVTDILGLNPITRKILANAAGAVCGMAHVELQMEKSEKPVVAITNVGITTQGAMRAMEVLKDAGYETIVFHAIGPEGRAMEQMMREGIISAVLDYSPIEVTNHIFDALLNGGPERLTTAGKLGIPQVLATGAIEVLVFNEPETIPERFRDRTMIAHSPVISDVRLNAREMVELGKEIVKRLQYTKDKAYFMIPTAGYDSYAVEGGGFHDPEADAAFVAELERGLPDNIEIIKRNTHIEDPAFAEEAARKLIELIEGKELRSN